MKKRIFLTLLFTLAACDNSAPEQVFPTIASMIATGTEQSTFECEGGRVSLNCDVLSEDQQVSGKWHHAKFQISNYGDVNLKIDGRFFMKNKSDNGFYNGGYVKEFTLIGEGGNVAKIKILDENEDMWIELKEWTHDSKILLSSSKKLSLDS